MNQLDLQGRHAVVTGGAAGLGFAISERLLASGATVTWWDRDESAMADASAKLGNSAVDCIAMDVASHASVLQAVRQTVLRHPTIDILVNSEASPGRTPRYRITTLVPGSR